MGTAATTTGFLFFVRSDQVSRERREARRA
jgi:hypothetical protein